MNRCALFCILSDCYISILVPRGHAHFGRHQESRPLAGSDVLGMHRELVSYSLPIRFVRHDSELGQSDGKSVSVGPSQRLRFLVLTRISAASGDENDALAVQLCWLYTTATIYPS